MIYLELKVLFVVTILVFVITNHEERTTPIAHVSLEQRLLMFAATDLPVCSECCIDKLNYML